MEVTDPRRYQTFHSVVVYREREFVNKKLVEVSGLAGDEEMRREERPLWLELLQEAAKVKDDLPDALKIVQGEPIIDGKGNIIGWRGRCYIMLRKPKEGSFETNCPAQSHRSDVSDYSTNPLDNYIEGVFVDINLDPENPNSSDGAVFIGETTHSKIECHLIWHL
jgi:hypothetical protein